MRASVLALRYTAANPHLLAWQAAKLTAQEQPDVDPYIRANGGRTLQPRALRGRGRLGHKGDAAARVIDKHGAARHEVRADDAGGVQAQVQAIRRREQAADALKPAACAIKAHASLTPS